MPYYKVSNSVVFPRNVLGYWVAGYTSTLLALNWELFTLLKVMEVRVENRKPKEKSSCQNQAKIQYRQEEKRCSLATVTKIYFESQGPEKQDEPS